MGIMLLYIVAFGAIFYFLAVRPQRKQRSQHQEMVSMLKKGDEVVTIGGMYGTVRRIGDDWVEVEIARGTRVRFMKRAISSITVAEEEEEEDEYVEADEDVEYEDEEAAGELEAGDESEDEVEEEADEEEMEYDSLGDDADAEAEDLDEEPADETPPSKKK